MTRKWKKALPDGTNYAYWESEDGFVIETKPRFRPSIPYTLHLPKRLQELGSYSEILFDTLALAKDGATWPDDKLLEAAKARTAAYVDGCRAAG